MGNQQMKLWELSAFGRENLQLVDGERPTPALGEVLVEVEAVSLNYRDLLIVQGQMGPDYVPPLRPGSEFSGKVVEIGSGVTRFQVGDHVISCDIAGWIDGAAPTLETNASAMHGLLAQYVAVDAERLVLAPATLSAIEAATFPCAGLTAWMAVVELGHVHASQTIVVQGTGGVSLFATQFALAHGARVLVTTSSAEKIARLQALGPAEAIDRSLWPQWQERVLELTGPRGADHILEMVGGENIGRSLQAVSLAGRISIIGLLGSFELGGPTGLVLYKRATLAGIGVGPRRVLEDMVRAVDRLKIKPVIDAVYDFDDAPAAYDHLARGAFGKVVIRVN
jgi:NADPH:quinone reductase-like Zn-dependent oxidoreductase